MTLGRAYDEIMEKIKVTPEMRRRVLERIAQEDIPPAPPKVMRSYPMRKYLSAAACIVLLLAGAAALPRLPGRTGPEPPVLTTPDIAEAASLDELSERVGFAVLTAFSLPFDAEETTYYSLWGEIAEVSYSGGEYTATYRQSLGTDDHSGDYNTYSDTAEILANGLRVTLKGSGGLYVLATWTDGTYAYSLSISPGVPAEDWRVIL